MPDKTPIQFADDERQLLRQIAGLVQDMNFRLIDVDGRLSNLERKVDERLHDTKPMWEAVNNRLSEIETRLEQVETRLGQVETRLGQVETRLDRIEAQLALTATKEDVRDIDRGYRQFGRDINRWMGDFDDRLQKLEKR